MSRQVVVNVNPRQSILYPDVILRHNRLRMIEAANGDVYFIGVRLTQERYRRATVWAERANPPGPGDLAGRAVSEPKIVPTEGGPGHKRCAGALATIGAMAMRNVIRFASRFIADRSAQTTSVINVLCHVKCSLCFYLCFTVFFASSAILSNVLVYRAQLQCWTCPAIHPYLFK
jgi:hypothetical protein